MKATSTRWFLHIVIFLTLTGSIPWFTAAPGKALAAQPEAPAETPITGEILPGKVIVKYKQQPASSRFSLRALTEASGVPLVQTVSFDESIPVADKMKELAQDPNVEYAEPVYRTHLLASTAPASVTAAVYSGPQEYMKHWGTLVTKMDEARSFTTPEQNGQVTVAVLDTGIDMTHPHFKGMILPGYDFVNKDDNAQDDHGHGTHVSGIITSAPSGTGLEQTAVAPGTRIMPLKVLDSKGGGDTATLIEALKYAIDHGADIVNMSLGVNVDSKAVHDVIREAYKRKMVLVAAAGNSSSHWINNEPGQTDEPAADQVRYAALTSYPAAYDEVVSVGAVSQLPDGSFTVADFSDVGKIDVVAPGVNIFSSIPKGKYGYSNGTSHAAPFVTGFAALLKAYNRTLDPDDIGTILRTSADIGSLGALPSNAYANFKTKPNDHVSSVMAYGAGLIQGGRGFRVPRLEITPVSADYPSNLTLTYDVSLLDVSNTVVNATYGVGLEVRYYNETLVDRAEDMLFGTDNQRPAALAGGYARLSTTLPKTDVHHLYVYGYWQEPDSAAGSRMNRSNVFTLIQKPAAPTLSLAAGTYTGNQQVTLSTPYTEGTIIYRLQTESGTDNTASMPASGGTLTLKENSRLTLVTLHAGVFSEQVSYLYRIQAAPIVPAAPPSGGGGGGGWPAPASPSPSPSPEPGLVKPATDELLKQLAQGDKLMIEAGGTGTDQVTVELETAVLRQAADAGKPVVIGMDHLRLELPPRFLDLPDTQKANLRLRVSKPSAATAPLGGTDSLRSPVYDFALTVDGQSVGSFRTPIHVVFQVDDSHIQAQHRTGIFTYNETSRTWEFAGGLWDSSSGTVSAKLKHFSRYAVIEKNKSFADIQGHWAQREIEAAAAWGTVDGMTDELFVPEEKLTRAQMAALLSKALKLEKPATAAGFDDVAEGDWFAPYVNAAKQAGLVEGIGDGRFAPNRNITREQLAVMLLNAYLRATGQSAKEIAVTQEPELADRDAVSGWAQEQVRLVRALGLMSSVSGNTFDPKGETTRAQAAAVIHRLQVLLMQD